jgi:UDP-N-acetylmuramyl pentapeptide phosphotransferase/UDP-N-acetylglucosamine-1-phosphate transferase
LALDNFLAPALSAIATFLLIFWMLKSPRLKLLLDHPNPRSLHLTPMPRTGGVAVMIGAFIGGVALLPNFELALAIAALLAIVSFFDDSRGLPIAFRLLAHVLAAAIFVAMALPELSLLAKAAIVLAIVWVTNLYNFMDGSDGLAGGMSLIGFGAYALAAWLQGDTSFSLLNASIAAAAAAFLVFNFPPAKIFLGDAGSVPLGFLAAALGLAGWQHGFWPLAFPLLVFSPFIIDATTTLIKRLARREKVWQAHHSHYYQRLIRMGWGHRKTAVAEYVVMLAAAASAVFVRHAESGLQLGTILAWGIFYLATMALIDHYWRRHEVQL